VRLLRGAQPAVVHRGQPVLWPSTVWFSERQVPEGQRADRPNATALLRLRTSDRSRALWFRMGDGAVPFRVVLNTFRLTGFRQTERGDWNVLWAKRVAPEEYEDLNPFQRINHFPGTWGIGRKDSLARNLARMQKRFGDAEYGFFPATYVLPGDHAALTKDFARRPTTLIIKPVASACGRGVRLLHRLPRPDQFPGCLAQQYIGAPLLLNGFKFDIRLYVVVTSFDPLRVFLFDEGLVRLAAEPYPGGASRLHKRCMHLTNYSVNHLNAKYVEPDSLEGKSASKWSLGELRAWWVENQKGLKRTWPQVWAAVQDRIIKTLISVEAAVVQQSARLCRHPNTCFELYGFDVLLDRQCRPWVLEVNIMPSLSPSSLLDYDVKSQLISHLLTLVGVVPYDRKAWRAEEGDRRQHRLTASAAPGGPVGRGDPVRDVELMNLLLSDRPMGAILPLLTDAEKDLLLYSDSELARRGHFYRIFPTADTWARYGRFFETPRLSDALLHRWEQTRQPPT